MESLIEGLKLIWMVPVGFVVGIYGTIVGLGGGFVLMPLLLLLYPKRPHAEMSSISLAVVLVNAASGSIAYGRMRRIKYLLGIAFGLATVPGAILGRLTLKYLPRYQFNIAFAFILMAAALVLMRRRYEKSRAPGPEGSDLGVSPHVPPRSLGQDLAIGVPLSLFVGYLAAIFGIGGGIVHVPAMVHLLGFPVHMATATSTFVLIFMSLTSTLASLVQKELTLQGSFWQILWLSIGVVGGAQVGARLSAKLKSTWIIRGLCLALVLSGLYLLVRTLTGK